MNLSLDLDRALDYLEFVNARHQVWEARQAGLPQPWTDDPVIATRKFTNVFRVLDPGSQFVITDLMPDCDSPTFLMRCFLYRHTNRPDAWRTFAAEWGSYPDIADLEALRSFWHFWPGQIFSSAYMIYPQSSTPGTNKMDSVIDLTQRLWSEEVFHSFVGFKTQQGRFSVLRKNKGVADFMSMQILTDFGYATEFRENDFVVPGPGCRKGAAEMSRDPAEKVVKWAFNAIRDQEHPPMVEGRLPSLMDCQNTLCEYSKWVRYQERPVPGQLYLPAHPGRQPRPVLPPAW